MLEKRKVVQGFCLFGMLGVLAAGTGCGELKRLRRENQQLNENVSTLQQENAELSTKATQCESELKRLENSRKELESKLKGTG
ncbi:MAG TPA: hypothetical protein ACFYDZ_09820, partial [Candidatus Brocadiaceae bacterium]